jgi:uncharacterized protein with PIN domain
MIIDTSPLVAVLDQEPEAERIVRILASAPERTLSAANLVEMGTVCKPGAATMELVISISCWQN